MACLETCPAMVLPQSKQKRTQVGCARCPGPALTIPASQHTVVTLTVPCTLVTLGEPTRYMRDSHPLALLLALPGANLPNWQGLCSPLSVWLPTI